MSVNPLLIPSFIIDPEYIPEGHGGHTASNLGYADYAMGNVMRCDCGIEYINPVILVGIKDQRAIKQHR